MKTDFMRGTGNFMRGAGEDTLKANTSFNVSKLDMSKY